MLSDKELVEALIVNLSSWDWSLFSKFSIDQATAEALINEIKRLRESLHPDFDCAMRD